MTAPVSILMASTAQKMVSLLALNCPSNYNCGGPAYGAAILCDTLLQLMGVGTAVVTRRSRTIDTTEFQKRIRKEAVSGDSVLGKYFQHKAQIVAGSVHAILYDLREEKIREHPEVLEKAMLSIVHWYLEKSGTSLEDFTKKLLAGGHDELFQIEQADPGEQAEFDLEAH